MFNVKAGVYGATLINVMSGKNGILGQACLIAQWETMRKVVMGYILVWQTSTQLFVFLYALWMQYFRKYRFVFRELISD